MATRTAPTIDGSPPFVTLLIRMIDARNDKRSFNIDIDPSATNTDIDAAVNALQTATNASIYEVKVQAAYSGAALVTNATNAVFTSADDLINITFRNAGDKTTRRAEIRAPLGQLVDGGEVVNTDDAIYIAVRDAFNTILPLAYDPVSARFTERSNKNSAVPA